MPVVKDRALFNRQAPGRACGTGKRDLCRVSSGCRTVNERPAEGFARVNGPGNRYRRPGGAESRAKSAVNGLPNR